MSTRGAVRGVQANTPAAVGMGLVALDVVVTDGKEQQPRYFAGGTCGNVLTILRHLGWRARPVARLNPGVAASWVLDDLGRWGVSTEFITILPDGSTPIIIHRIRRRDTGEPYHTFSWRCQSCGAHLPGYKAVLTSSAQDLAPRIGRVNVFFFDRVSRGVLVLADQCRRQGGVVVFEPSSVGVPRLFREAWTVAHIVKYSHERLRDIADVEFARGERDRVLLEVETLGPSGVRYRSRLPLASTEGWMTMDAFSPTGLKDAGGAGDWCTAGLIDRLAREGVLGLIRATVTEVKDSIRFGQALAAWNCGFEGARGGMYEVDKRQCDREVAHILEGVALHSRWNGLSSHDVREAVERVCPACSGVEAAQPVSRPHQG